MLSRCANIANLGGSLLLFAFEVAVKILTDKRQNRYVVIRPLSKANYCLRIKLHNLSYLIGLP